jgi:hypothetical protein
MKKWIVILVLLIATSADAQVKVKNLPDGTVASGWYTMCWSTGTTYKCTVDSLLALLTLAEYTAPSTGAPICATAATTVGACTAGTVNRAVCWKTGGILGYCSSAPDANGACTCN